ncbi:hypothetical protein IAT38_007269 [Cryptococcus sp. DSM 104549]
MADTAYPHSGSTTSLRIRVDDPERLAVDNTEDTTSTAAAGESNSHAYPPLSSTSTAVSARSQVDLSEDKSVRELKRGDSLYRRIVDTMEHAVLNLAPAFFSLNMGTGIASILLFNLPFQAAWLRHLGVIVFVLNVALFVLLSLGTIVRFIRWKGIFTAILKHPASGLFWGTLPMGLITIVNMIAFALVPSGGIGWAKFVVALWWIDVVMSVVVNLGMIFLMFTRQTHTAESMSAAWLLPIVSSVVAAASGGIVATSILPTMPLLARSIVLTSYVIWGTGVPLAMFVITIYMHRTIVHGIPAAAAIPTVFLPLGPCGQGSFGIVILGRTVRALAYEHGIGLGILPPAGAGDVATAALRRDAILRMADAVYAGGLVTGLILWGLGFCWYVLATFCWYVLATAVFVDHVWTKNRGYMGQKAFSVGFTALTFPIGVWATATTTLATELDSLPFKIIGTVVSIQVVLNWIYVMVMSLYKSCDRSLFVAPELASFPDKTPPLRFGGGSRGSRGGDAGGNPQAELPMQEDPLKDKMDAVEREMRMQQMRMSLGSGGAGGREQGLGQGMGDGMVWQVRAGEGSGGRAMYDVRL